MVLMKLVFLLIILLGTAAAKKPPDYVSELEKKRLVMVFEQH